MRLAWLGVRQNAAPLVILSAYSSIGMGCPTAFGCPGAWQKHGHSKLWVKVWRVDFVETCCTRFVCYPDVWGFENFRRRKVLRTPSCLPYGRQVLQVKSSVNLKNLVRDYIEVLYETRVAIRSDCKLKVPLAFNFVKICCLWIKIF